MHIAVEHHALHGLVVVKSASGAEDEERLAREAAVLLHAGVPGVAELIDHDGTPGRSELRARHAGTRTALALGGARAASVAGFGAGLATTLAALHARGLSHNAVEASHVLVGPSGEPVLCGLGHVGGDEERWAGRITFDPSDAGFDPARDIGDLVTLLDDLVGRGTGWRDAWPRHRLRRLLREVVATEPDQRPSAAALASTLAAFAGSRLPSTAGAGRDDVEGSDDPLDPPTRSFGPSPTRTGTDVPSQGRRRRVAALVAVTALAGALTAAAVSAFSGPGAASASARPSTTSAPSTSEAPVPTSSTGAPTDTTALSRDGDVPGGGQGCPTDYAAAEAGIPSACAGQLSVEGNSVALGSLRWVVGDDGDHLAVSDVDCDGTIEAALLRPATGELFVFGSWAPPEGPVTATPLRALDHAVGISAGADGCGLVATHVDGATSALDAAALW
ncbi:MAG: hypothetical protein GEV08_24165 [Acidimicrobiia bacterium]|nr:hypothetical protein [Acidimicrobiia bacterium]